MTTFKTGILGLVLAIAGGAVLSGLAPPGLPRVPRDSPTGLVPPWFAFRIGCKLHEWFRHLAFLTQPADAYAIELATSGWNAEVAYALIENEILDRVERETAKGGTGTGTVSCETVAAALDLRSFVVCRYMEAGRHLRLLDRDGATKEYTLTPHGRLLTRTGRLRDFVRMINGSPVRIAWRAVATDLMRDGGRPGRNSGWEIATGGRDAFSWFAENPEQEATFDGAMKSVGGSANGAFLMDWTPPPTRDDAVFCDMGGGVGAVLGDVLNHYPRMTGIVFDRPSVAGRAGVHLASAGVGDRARFVGGDFLEDELPSDFAKCDVFFLRYVLHGFDDASSVRILDNIRRVAAKDDDAGSAMKKTVVVMDQVIDTGANAFFERAKSLMAINMIANSGYGSRERTVPEHGDLFRAAGYGDISKGGGGLRLKHVPLRTIESLVVVEF